MYHNDCQTFYDMTRLVIQKGRKRLGYIGALSRDEAVGRERKRACRDAVRQAGPEEQAEHTAAAAFSMDSGREKARELLEAYGPLDALIRATDNMAAGALQYPHGQGITVPKRMLLTGHGASGISEVTTHPITTIRFFYEEGGVSAANLMLELLEKTDTPAKEIKPGYTILENESTNTLSQTVP